MLSKEPKTIVIELHLHPCVIASKGLAGSLYMQDSACQTVAWTCFLEWTFFKNNPTMIIQFEDILSIWTMFMYIESVNYQKHYSPGG